MSQYKITVYILCGSIDDRSENIKKLEEKLKNEPVEYRFIKTSFGNIGTDRHNAIQSINTEFVAYMDDDDDFVPGAFSIINDYIDEHPNEDIFCPLEYCIIPSERLITYPILPKDLEYFPPQHHRLMHHIFPMRTSLAKVFSRCMIGHVVNCEIVLKSALHLAGYRVKIIPEYLYYWIINPFSATSDRGPSQEAVRYLNAVRHLKKQDVEIEQIRSNKLFKSYIKANPDMIPKSYYKEHGRHGVFKGDVL